MNALLAQATVLFKNRRKSVLYISLTILTVALEEIFEQIVFKCPCTDHFAYGMAFICAPALLLFIFGIVLDSNAMARRFPCTKPYADETQSRAVMMLRSSLDVFELLIRAVAAPMAWVILSLLRKQYYLCAFFGPPLNAELTAHQKNATDECGKEEVRRLKEQISYQTHSQVVGCWLMAAMIAAVLFLVVLQRCAGKRKHIDLPFQHIYLHIEARAAVRELHKEAKRLAEEHGRETVRKCLTKEREKLPQNNDYMIAVTKVRSVVIRRYSSFFLVPDTPLTPDTPSKDGSHSPDGPPFFHSNSEADERDRMTGQPSTENVKSNCTNMWNNLVRVKLHRRISTQV